MMSDNGFLSNNIPFTSFGHSHAIAVFIFIILLGLFTLAALRLNDRENLIVTRISSLFLCFTVVAWTAITLAFDRFNVDHSLPLSICNLFYPLWGDFHITSYENLTSRTFRHTKIFMSQDP